VVGLQSRNVETVKYGAAHVVIKYWDVEAAKWILCDVQVGLMVIDDNQVYMSAYELSVCINKGVEPQYMPVEGSRTGCDGIFGQESGTYLEWVKRYVHFIDVFLELKTEYLNGLAPEKIVMLVPESSVKPIMFQGAFKMNALYVNDAGALIRFSDYLQITATKSISGQINKKYYRMKV
jgi:hypothetical protein